MTQATPIIQIDTRLMDSKSRRTLAFSAFEPLDVDAVMELLSDHDPVTLRSQFELKKPNLFSWAPLESGPDVWRVAVTKLKGKHGVDQCCGACGGQVLPLGRIKAKCGPLRLEFFGSGCNHFQIRLQRTQLTFNRLQCA